MKFLDCVDQIKKRKNYELESCLCKKKGFKVALRQTIEWFIQNNNQNSDSTKKYII